MLFFCSNAADVIVVVVIALWLPVMDIFFVDACNFFVFNIQTNTHTLAHNHTKPKPNDERAEEKKTRTPKCLENVLLHKINTTEFFRTETRPNEGTNETKV